MTETDKDKIASGAAFVDQDDLRSAFASAMSSMYKDEVPRYGDLVQIVREVNQAVEAEEKAAAAASLDRRRHLCDYGEKRLDLERHGAIRLGSPQELHLIRRIFALIGLYPVGYYDLSAADLPMHATAFRPVCRRSLARNPFRVFTTLLRPELLDPRIRELALSLINSRKMFTNELLSLVELAETQGGFTAAQSQNFICEAMKSFQWQKSAVCSIEVYQELKSEHPILADISCFGTAHINHLTPRTLDIDRAYSLMKRWGLKVKDSVEGPPRRSVPVLLRQTSFLALEEPTSFSVTATHTASKQPLNAADEQAQIRGTHKARFGEIEQRGAALTPAGRALYDELVAEGRGGDSVDEASWSSTFDSHIPDDWDALVDQGLVYCLFRVDSERSARNRLRTTDPVVSARELLKQGILTAHPQTYEDFLPVSAAGIFRSNLSEEDDKNSDHSEHTAGIRGADSSTSSVSSSMMDNKIRKCSSAATRVVNWSFADQDGFEAALGEKVIDPYQWYQRAQEESLRECGEILNLKSVSA